MEDIIWILFKMFLAYNKNNTSRKKNILNTVPNWRFWTFSAKNPSTTKIVPSIACSNLNMSVVFFSLNVVLITMFYSICLHTSTVIGNFDINWSDRNCLKSWRVTYKYLKIRSYTCSILINKRFLSLYKNGASMCIRRSDFS